MLKKIINETVADLFNKEYMETLIDKLKSSFEEVVVIKIAEATKPLTNKKLDLYKAHMDQLETGADPEQFLTFAKFQLQKWPRPSDHTHI